MSGVWNWITDFFGITNEAGPGYGFWSGFAGSLTIFTGGFVYLRSKQCHLHRCIRFGHHSVSTRAPSGIESSYMICHKHHRDLHHLSKGHKLTMTNLLAAHQRHLQNRDKHVR